MPVDVSEGISIGIGVLSLIGLYRAALHKKTRWPVDASLLKLGIYSLIIVLNVLQGWWMALIPNGLALVAWSWMALRRGIPRRD